MRTTHLCGVWVSRKKEINCTFSFCIFSTSEKSINIFDIKIKWLKPSAAFSNLMFNEINRILQTVSSVQCPSLTVLHAIMFIRLFFSCKDPSISIHYICSTKLHRSTYVAYQHGSNSLLLLGRCKHSCWCLSQQEWFVQTKEKLRLKKIWEGVKTRIETRLSIRIIYCSHPTVSTFGAFSSQDTC